MFYIDVKKIREDRYKINFNKALEFYKNVDVVDGKNHLLANPKGGCLTTINFEEYTRIKKEFCNSRGILEENFLSYHKQNEDLLWHLAKQTSVDASRQGKLDEAFIFDGLKDSLKEFVTVKQIPSGGKNSIRPHKNGGIISGHKLSKETRKTECLKSIDGTISSEFMNGYIFAKVELDQGGSQDSVDQEACSFIEWAIKEPTDKFYIILFDGNKEMKDFLKKKETQNIWVCDHIELQERIVQYVESRKNIFASGTDEGAKNERIMEE